MKFYIRANDRRQQRAVRAVKGQTQQVSIDLSALADDIGALTGATWEVKSGNATVAGEALASNVATANVTTPERGDSMLKITATNATYSHPVYIRVFAKDPSTYTSWDYGMVA